jgi:hypothetical protein
LTPNSSTQAARRERPLKGRAHQDRRAADILATPAARRSRACRLTSMDSHRPGVTNFVHVGLVVEDLDETVGFLALLGLAQAYVSRRQRAASAR